MNRRTAIYTALLIASLVGGCGKHDVPESPKAAAKVALPAANDPCRFLEASEVEAVLGMPLAGAPFRATGRSFVGAGTPDPKSESCWYITSDFHDLVVKFTPKGGSDILRGIGAFLGLAEQGTKGTIRLQDGTQLAGEWDEARIVDKNTFMALRGDSLIELEFGGTSVGEAQIAKLADAAIRRFDHPLSIDGAAGIAAAEAHDKQRPEPVAICALLDPADIESTLGKIVRGPESDSKDDPKKGRCSAMYLDAHGQQHTVTLAEIKWRDGFHKYRDSVGTLDAIARAHQNDTGGVDHSAEAWRNGPWDAAARLMTMNVATVKRDVYIEVYVPGDDRGKLPALMSKIYARLKIGDPAPG